MEIEYSKNFIKQLKKAPTKIQMKLRARIELFKDDKFNPILRNHALKGEWKGYRSIDVSGDWRAIFIEFEDGKSVSFELLDTHSGLYG